MISRRARETAAGWAVWLVLCVGCGGDDGGGGAGTGAPSGDPCLQAGFTDTTCQCLEGGIGVRECTSDLVYTECVCRTPVVDMRCAPGDPLDCTCPDGTQRQTMCLDEGTFDCPCGDAGAAADDDAG